MNLAGFRAAHPEFNSRVCPDELIETKLSAAAARIDASRYGDTYDEAHGLLTAHLLAVTPYGQNTRLDPKSINAIGASTTYEAEFRKLERMAATMIRVW